MYSGIIKTVPEDDVAGHSQGATMKPKKNVHIQTSCTNRVVINAAFTGGGGGGGPASCTRSFKRHTTKAGRKKERG